MALNAFPSRSNIPNEWTVRVRGLGANTTALSLQEGAAGITSARTGEGAYKFTFSDNPGTLVSWYASFGAATPGDMAGYTAVRDTWDSSGLILEFVVYNSSFAAADVIANQYIDITMVFRQGGVQ